jgi:hypothetical protein
MIIVILTLLVKDNSKDSLFYYSICLCTYFMEIVLCIKHEYRFIKHKETNIFVIIKKRFSL